jgi:hypothetical protein
MEKSQDLKSKIDVSSSNSNELSAVNNANLSSIPSQDQIRNLLLVMTDREDKLSELATQQQRFILWRVQFVRLEREWNDVRQAPFNIFLLFLHKQQYDCHWTCFIFCHC